MNTSLKYLRLGYNGLCFEGLDALAESLETNETLLELDLTCTRVNDLGLTRLTKALTTNRTLTHLRVSQ